MSYVFNEMYPVLHYVALQHTTTLKLSKSHLGREQQKKLNEITP